MSGPEDGRLVLVRHGQASLGAAEYDQLSELGYRQAGRVARRLSDSRLHSPVFWRGTLRRHRQTLDALLDDGDRTTVETSADLDEFSTYGLVRAGLRQAEPLGLSLPAREHLDDPKTHLSKLLVWFGPVLEAWQEGRLSDPDLGSWPAFRQRVLRPIGSWSTCMAGGRSVVVVSSAGVIATVVAALARRSLAWQRELAVSLYNASVSEMTFTGGEWMLDTCNCTRHLEAEGLQTLA